MVFKTDKNFVTKVAIRAFAPSQLLRQFCLRQNRIAGSLRCKDFGLPKLTFVRLWPHGQNPRPSRKPPMPENISTNLIKGTTPYGDICRICEGA